jgi:membrane protease YdiL (CAAX protease family)
MVEKRSRILPEEYVRRVALLALVTFAVEEVVTALVFLFRNRTPVLQESLLLPLTTTLTHWALPLLVVFYVEGSDVRSLGLTLKRENIVKYLVYLFVGLVVPGFFLGFGQGFFFELIEQILQIGVAEEVFFRGYLLHRFADWLGNPRGLVLGAITFGFAHVVSRVSQHGWNHLIPDVTLGIQMFFGGLVMGCIYLRTRSLLPCATLHVSANLYLDMFIKLLGM